MSISPVPTEVAAMIDQARNAFQSGGNTHEILIDLPSDLPPVLADRGRIVQVLNNLFSNAARFSLGSSPIRVAAKRDGLHVAVSVLDEGEGIPSGQLPRLFRKHGNLGDDDRRGSGLGLAICKGLVEAHGGRIWAQSDGPDQGLKLPSRSRYPRKSASRPAPPATSYACLGRETKGPVSWWWTTTHRCSALCVRR